MSTDANQALTALSSAIGHAIHVGFSEIVYKDRDWEHFYRTKESREIEKRRRPNVHDIEVFAVFPQTWSSTALGFGGIGGQAMTRAYTVVLECNGEYAVYFDGSHAYTLKCIPNDRFYADLCKQQMCAVKDVSVYLPT